MEAFEIDIRMILEHFNFILFYLVVLLHPNL